MCFHSSNGSDSFPCLLQLVEPIGEILEHGLVVWEAFLDAEAVAALGIDVQGGGDAEGAEGQVVVHTIGRGHGTVVVGQQEDGRRCELIDLPLIAVELHQRVAGIAADEVVVRATVGAERIHRHHGVEQYLELRTHLLRCTRGHGAGQVTAGREAHDAYLLWVDAEVVGIGLEITDAVIDVVLRYLVMAIRHAVGEDHEVDALAIEVRCPERALVVEREVRVATAGQAHHGAAGADTVGRLIDVHVGLSGPSVGGAWGVLLVAVELGEVAVGVDPYLLILLGEDGGEEAEEEDDSNVSHF